MYLHYATLANTFLHFAATTQYHAIFIAAKFPVKVMWKHFRYGLVRVDTFCYASEFTLSC